MFAVWEHALPGFRKVLRDKYDLCFVHRLSSVEAAHPDDKGAPNEAWGAGGEHTHTPAGGAARQGDVRSFVSSVKRGAGDSGAPGADTCDGVCFGAVFRVCCCPKVRRAHWHARAGPATRFEKLMI